MKPLMHGTPPLTARLEPWMDGCSRIPQLCQELVDTFGSPVNLHDFSALGRNAEQLRAAAARHAVDFQVYFARKANKTIGAIDHAVAFRMRDRRRQLPRARRKPCGRGVDPAADHRHGRRQVSVRCSGWPWKTSVVVSLDNRDEAEDLLEVAALLRACEPRVALRLASYQPGAARPRALACGPQTGSSSWAGQQDPAPLEVAGIHFHLNGYSAERAGACPGGVRGAGRSPEELGHAPGFIDMGGGIPMSYLTMPRAVAGILGGARRAARRERGHHLEIRFVGSRRRSNQAGGVYPYHQHRCAAEWLETSWPRAPWGPREALPRCLRERNLQLRCEPGRSLLDGCGLTLAKVAFGKERSDGVPLLGLHMNRTQCRSTSADFLLDPILLHAAEPRRAREPFSGFLVGAYCIEEELILRRRFEFPLGAAPNDVVAFPNTAGYLMHIVESASHQLPLAVNLVRDGDTWAPDEIEENVLRS